MKATAKLITLALLSTCLAGPAMAGAGVGGAGVGTGGNILMQPPPPITTTLGGATGGTTGGGASCGQSGMSIDPATDNGTTNTLPAGSAVFYVETVPNGCTTGSPTYTVTGYTTASITYPDKQGSATGNAGIPKVDCNGIPTGQIDYLMVGVTDKSPTADYVCVIDGQNFY